MMNDKYSPQQLEVSPRSIIARHYGTHSAQRATTNEEFNKDGAYMVIMKQLYMSAEEVFRNTPSPQHKLEADLIFNFVKSENDRLRKKHWPNSKPHSN